MRIWSLFGMGDTPRGPHEVLRIWDAGPVAGNTHLSASFRISASFRKPFFEEVGMHPSA
jgi:hypothetical protein